MASVPLTNISQIPQSIAHIWIPPHQSRQVPLVTALRYHQDERFWLNPKDIHDALVSSRTEGVVQGFTFTSPISLSDGYGQGGVFMAEGVLNLGLDLDLYSQGWFNSQGLSSLIRNTLKKPKVGYDFGVGRGYPIDVIPKLPAKHKIANTMWESHRIPHAWVPVLNECAAVIVPCKAQIPLFRDSGVKRPFHTLPEPVDIPYWSQRRVQPSESQFKIVSWSRMSSRKMPMEMVQVFSYAFPADKYPDVVFELKTNNSQFGAGHALIPNIRDSRIRIYDGIWTLDQLRDWVSSAHLGFFLSRGEGMFVPPMQAMALGVPVVVPNHTGPSDYADSRYNYPVELDTKTPLVPSPMGEGKQDLLWWNPSLEHAVEQLRAAYTNYSEAKKRAKAAQDMVKRRYSVEAVSQRLAQTVEKYA